MEYAKVDLTSSRHLPIYKGINHDLKEVWLSTVRLDPHVIEGIKKAITDGHWGEHPYEYFLCFFKEEKGNLDLFPLPLVLEIPDEELPTDWLRYCKLKLEEALHPSSD